MRLSEDEDPEDVLARLRDNEPRWTPHAQAPENPAAARHPRGAHAGATGRSATGESRETFQRRHAAWRAAVEREEKRKKEGPPKLRPKDKAALKKAKERA